MKQPPGQDKDRSQTFESQESGTSIASPAFSDERARAGASQSEEEPLDVSYTGHIPVRKLKKQSVSEQTEYSSTETRKKETCEQEGKHA